MPTAGSITHVKCAYEPCCAQLVVLQWMKSVTVLCYPRRSDSKVSLCLEDASRWMMLHRGISVILHRVHLYNRIVRWRGKFLIAIILLRALLNV